MDRLQVREEGKHSVPDTGTHSARNLARFVGVLCFIPASEQLHFLDVQRCNTARKHEYICRLSL